jgi:Domain of unknown function (DUF1707)
MAGCSAAALRFSCIVLVWKVPVMAGPGDEIAAGAGGRGHLRASDADREQVISVLKAAFVQGLLAKDEFDGRVSQALASRTYAELAVLTADIPAGAPVVQPTRTPAQVQGWLTMKRAVTWSAWMLGVTATATVIGGVVADRIDAGAAFAMPFLAFLVATVVAGTMIVEAWDKKKRPADRCRRGRRGRHLALDVTTRSAAPTGNRVGRTVGMVREPVWTSTQFLLHPYMGHKRPQEPVGVCGSDPRKPGRKARDERVR